MPFNSMILSWMYIYVVFLNNYVALHFLSACFSPHWSSYDSEWSHGFTHSCLASLFKLISAPDLNHRADAVVSCFPDWIPPAAARIAAGNPEVFPPFLTPVHLKAERLQAPREESERGLGRVKSRQAALRGREKEDSHRLSFQSSGSAVQNLIFSRRAVLRQVR